VEFFPRFVSNLFRPIRGHVEISPKKPNYQNRAAGIIVESNMGLVNPKPKPIALEPIAILPEIRQIHIAVGEVLPLRLNFLSLSNDVLRGDLLHQPSILFSHHK
jgi:hypothetical protein